MTGQHFKCDIHLSGLHNNQGHASLSLQTTEGPLQEVSKLIDQSNVKFFSKISCRNQSEAGTGLINRRGSGVFSR